MRKIWESQKKYLFISLLFLVLFLEADLVFALEIIYPPVPGAEPPQVFLRKIEEGLIPSEQALPLYVKYFYGLFLMIAGLAALGAIILGGFHYLISAGSIAVMGEAKERIFAGILGLIILLSSYLILYTINPQLVIFQLGKEEIEMPEVEVPPPEEKEVEKIVFFQIPTGKIIERAIVYSPLSQLELGIRDLEEKAKELKEATEDLKNFLINECVCGTSGCSSINEETGEGCEEEGCPGAVCDEGRKQEKIGAVIAAAIALQEVKSSNIEMARPLAEESFPELQKAVLLMSIFSEELEDYNTMLASKYFIEEGGQEVEFDYLPGWENIKIDFGGGIVNDPATFYFIEEEEDKATIEEYVQLVEEYKLPPLELSLHSLEIPEGITVPTSSPEFTPTSDEIVWPAARNVTQSYGCLTTLFAKTWGYAKCVVPETGEIGGWHNGIDLSIRGCDFCPNIRSMAEGRVVDIKYGYNGGFGNWVLIHHPQLGPSGISSVYYHLSTIKVSPGDTVKVGQIVGEGDSTGAVAGAHLHFSTWTGVPSVARARSGGYYPWSPSTNFNPLNILP